MRLLLTLQYLGTRYAGWQSQINAIAIQDVVNDALTRLYGASVQVEGAGRTDAGVHATAQRAHCDVPFEVPLRGLTRGLNDLLPPDIRITAVEQVADDFNCGFAAKSKSYVYRIWNSDVMDVFHAGTYAHVPGSLDVGVMSGAAAGIIGTHDFRAFTVAEPEVATTVRTIADARVEREGEALLIGVTADGFLRYMVRRIAGSLIEIGRGKLEPASLRRSLEPDFEPARWTAPARGLTLEKIDY
jgi:tRNA pseudouridine38-40 synthase